MKYISFQSSSSEYRIRYFYTNNCKNLKGKYKILYNTYVNQSEKIDNETISIKIYILKFSEKVKIFSKV